MSTLNAKLCGLRFGDELGVNKMAIVFDSVSIKGMRLTHFEQLMSALQEREDEGSYYGNKEQYIKRHVEIKNWLQGIIDTARDSDFRIPK